MLKPKGSLDSSIAASGAVLALTDLWTPGIQLKISCETVTSISCALGGGHTALVCASGRVYTYGENTCGQLGLGHESRDELKEPTVVAGLDSPDIRVVEVACGSKHTLFCTADNKLFSCGGNGSGQLGLGHNENQSTPQLVALGGVKAVAAGSCHSVVLTISGRVYVWGSNESSQLGLGSFCVTKKVPKWLIHVHGNVQQVACGLDHTAILTVRNKLYLCGSNLYGQLGMACDEGQAEELREVIVGAPVGAPVVAVACGGIHTVALTENGKVYAWGDNSCHQLGIGDGTTFSAGFPVHVTSLNAYNVSQVACGWLHTALVTEDGLLFTMGHGTDGQLCDEDQEIAAQVSTLDCYKVSKVACGSQHTLVCVAPRQYELIKEPQEEEQVEEQEEEEQSAMSYDLKTMKMSKSTWQLNVDPSPDPDLDPSPPPARRNSDPTSTKLFLNSRTAETTPTSYARQRSVSKRKDTMMAHVQEVLECNICLETMQPPIYQCINGHNVCGKCRPQLQHCPTCRGSYADARNYALEHLSEKMFSSPPVACEQCSATTPAEEVDEHCCLRCPFSQPDCSWAGLIGELWQHLEEEHPDESLIGNLHSFIHTNFNGERKVLVIDAWEEIFALHIRHDTVDDSFQALVQHIGTPERAGNFMYKLEIFDDDHEESTLFRRKLRNLSEDVDECFEKGKCICEPMKTMTNFMGDEGLKCTVEIYDGSMNRLTSYSDA